MKSSLTDDERKSIQSLVTSIRMLEDKATDQNPDAIKGASLFFFLRQEPLTVARLLVQTLHYAADLERQLEAEQKTTVE